MPTNAEASKLLTLLDAIAAIGSHLEPTAMLQRIVEVAAELSDARYGALGVLDESGTRLERFITVGIDDATRAAIGHLPEGDGVLGELIVDPHPRRLSDVTGRPDHHGFPAHHPPMRSFLGVPIKLGDRVFGNLYLTDKTSAEAFSAVDEELIVALAAAAAAAIENDRLHAALRERVVGDDHERIARDLHDNVIQRLFAAGMALQSAVRLIPTDPAKAVTRIEGAAEGLDLAVKLIRTAVFGLDQRQLLWPGLRQQLLTVAHEAASALGFEPTVHVDGPIDTGVDDAIGDELTAVLREALSNVARHAAAARVDIDVVVDTTGACLVVVDDGGGPPGRDVLRGNGLRNMEARALKWGGSFDLRPGPHGGCVLEWKVPFTAGAVVAAGSVDGPLQRTGPPAGGC